MLARLIRSQADKIPVNLQGVVKDPVVNGLIINDSLCDVDIIPLIIR